MKPDNLAKDMLKAVHEVQKSVDAKKLIIPSKAMGCKGFLVLQSVKGAAVLGFERGYGMAFRVLETQPDGTPKLSAPVFVKLSKVAVGFQFGYNSVSTVVLLPNDAQLQALATTSEFIMGKDFDVSGLQQGEQTNTTTFHRTSISAVVNDGVHMTPTTLSVADSLMVADLSLYGGTLGVDSDIMRQVYGDPYGSPSDVLNGKVELPEALKGAVEPITRTLARMVSTAPSA